MGRVLTWFLHILIHHHEVAISPIRRPARYAPHLEPFPLLPSYKFRAGEDVHNLVAEVVRRASRLRGGRNEHFWRDTWVESSGEIGGERVICDVSGGLVLRLLYGLAVCVYGSIGDESGGSGFGFGVWVCGEEGRIVLPGVV